ncbi:phosphatase PAP2 family protein [Streptomyces sp. NPDC018019]|uniref:phosphatase PAP2 family protein n=1 Tax=Streptomyces sp. NPDC018019 TaxID=3365030 RepID=UPI00379F979A
MVGVLCAALLTVLTWQVASDGPLRALDERLGRSVARSSVPTPLAEFFADLGNAVVALPVLALAALCAAWYGRRAAAPRWWLPPLTAVLVMALTPALVVPLKTWLARPGPPEMAGGAHSGFFPSGHAATAAVAYGAVVLLLAASRPVSRERARRPMTSGVAALVGLLNVAVGIGLVRRGYHWPLDVLASWCLAGVLLTAGAGGRRAGRPHRPAGQPATPNSSDAM